MGCFTIIDFASILAFIHMSFGDLKINLSEETKMSFVEMNGTQFMMDGLLRSLGETDTLMLGNPIHHNMCIIQFLKSKMKPTMVAISNIFSLRIPWQWRSLSIPNW